MSLSELHNLLPSVIDENSVYGDLSLRPTRAEAQYVASRLAGLSQTELNKAVDELLTAAKQNPIMNEMVSTIFKLAIKMREESPSKK